MDDLFESDDPFRGRLNGRLAARHKPSRRVASGSAGPRSSSSRRSGRGRHVPSSPRGQRVAVVASIHKLGAQGHAKARAHANYLQRDGAGDDGRAPDAFTADKDTVDLDAFLERAKDDRHQFRMIVSPEQSHELDLDEYVRDYMERVEQDLGTDLDWAAVAHHNTDQPHAHIILRGRDTRAEDLYIDSDYLNQGLRHRAEAVATRHLGPRTREQQERAHARQREADHWTELDKHLVRAADERNCIRPDDVSRPDDGHYVSTKNAQDRLKYLASHGLAASDAAPRGAWQLADDLKARLQARRDKRDIIRRMQQSDAPPERWSLQKDPPVAGRVLDRGLSDEFADRHYLLIDGADGRAHHLEVDGGHPARVGDCVEVQRASRGVQVERRGDPEDLIEVNGPTWLDRHLEDATGHRGGVFGQAWAQAKRRRLQRHQRSGHLDDGLKPPKDLVKRLREDERRAFQRAYAHENGLQTAHLQTGENVEGHLSDTIDLRGGKVHVLETDDGRCMVVPSNRYLEKHADQRVRLMRKRGQDGRARTYVDSLQRDRGRNSKQNEGPER